jgi:hypothetical protein
MINDINFEEIKLATDFLIKLDLNFSYTDHDGTLKELPCSDVAFYILEKSDLDSFVTSLKSFSGPMPNDFGENIWDELEKSWQTLLKDSGMSNKNKCKSIW